MVGNVFPDRQQKDAFPLILWSLQCLESLAFTFHSSVWRVPFTQWPPGALDFGEILPTSSFPCLASQPSSLSVSI